MLAELSVIDRVSRTIKAKVREVIPSFRMVRSDDLTMTFEFTIALPGGPEAGRILLGPIRGQVVNSWRTNSQGQGREQMKAKALCATERAASPEVLNLFTYQNSESRRDRAPELAAQKYLHKRGMSRAAAWCLVTCPLTSVRAVVWAMLHDEPLEDLVAGLDPVYVDLLRRAYLGDLRPGRGPYSKPHNLRQRALDDVIACGGSRSLLDLANDLFHGRPRNERDVLRLALLQNPRQIISPVVNMGRSTTRDGLPGRPTIDVAARPCTHCPAESGAWFDLVLWVPEIPNGLLCSTCLRSPDPHSPVYPPT